MMRPKKLLSIATIPLFMVGCAARPMEADDGETIASVSEGLVAEGCTLALHAILRDIDTAAITGEVQLRIQPNDAGGDPVVTYEGALAPAGADLGYQTLEVELLPRVPDETPTWSDAKKTDPGTTLGSSNLFGGASLMPAALARALAADPSAFKTVVQVVTTTGGREAEGVVAPSREAPAELRDRARACF